jgi:hypothetical protein
MSVHMTWCVKRRDEYGNRHDEPTVYVPPGNMCIQERGINFHSICCSDGVAVYCITYDGAESYCTTEDRPEFVKLFIQRYTELINNGRGWEKRGNSTISAFSRFRIWSRFSP